MIILKLTCATCKKIQRLDRDDFAKRISSIPDPKDGFDRIITFRCDECIIPQDETLIDALNSRWN